MQISKAEALAAISLCLFKGIDGETDMVRVCKEFDIPSFFMASGALGIMEVPFVYIQHILDDEDLVDIAWVHHDIYGECMAVSHQCPEHPEDPADRNVVHFISVRRS